MKKLNIYSIVLTVVIAIITIYNQFIGTLTKIINIPMWLMLILILLPFLGFTLYCYVVSRVSRKFKIGDVVYQTNDEKPLVVIDYDRFNPSVVIVQTSISNTPPYLPIQRIDAKINVKYLIKKVPLTPAEAVSEYCREKGIIITDGRISES